jgi:hypothetical protein
VHHLFGINPNEDEEGNDTTTAKNEKNDNNIYT